MVTPAGAVVLPTPAMRLFGRAAELAAACALLRQPDLRLFALTGPPGVGKTRLAQAVARTVAAEFPDGIVFVDLAPVRETALVGPAVIRALALVPGANEPVWDALARHLRDRRLLLLLDNIEHVVEVAPAVANLVSSSLRLTVLVTSRVSLNIASAQDYPVAPLALPSAADLSAFRRLARTPAVALFVARARAAFAGFRLSQGNARAVTEICRQLDGLPLAIELAAARVKVLPPAALLSRLERRLALLRDDAADLPPQHRTLRVAIDWSYELLPPEVQRLFRQVGVFVGGFTLAAAEAVAGLDGTDEHRIRALDGLAALLDHHLLSRAERSDVSPRFAMLETLREYALERLSASGELVEARRRHAAFFLTEAQRQAPSSRGPGQQDRLDRLEQEHGNLQAALGWALEHDPATGLRLANALVEFWDVRGHFTTGRYWLEALLAHAGDLPAALRARALNDVSGLAYRQGDYALAQSRCTEALAVAERAGDRREAGRALVRSGTIAYDQGDYPAAGRDLAASLRLWRELGDDRHIADALSNLGNVAFRQGDQATARLRFEESLARRRALGDTRGIAISLFGLANVLVRVGDHPAARRAYEEVLALRRSLGDTRGIALAAGNLGVVAALAGEIGTARGYFTEALAAHRAVGDTPGIARTLDNLASLACDHGDYAASRTLYHECLTMRRELGDRHGIANTLDGLARLVKMQGQPAEAARLYGAADALWETLGVPPTGTERAGRDEDVAATRTALGEEAFAALWAEGRAMPPEQAVVYALAVPEPVPSAPGAPERSPNPLTPREQEITTLIARGRANAQIARELVLSERTVHTHVRNILAKLKLTSRAQVVAWAIEHGFG